MKTREAFYDVPRRGPTVLVASGELPPQIDESSGLAATSEPGIFWTHNDSGDAARVFAINTEGELVSPHSEGVPVADAENFDWEELASDFRGHLLIGAFGNNANRRKNLSIYQVPQQDPRTVITMQPTARWPIAYPDQLEFPPAANNFDCEAMFVAGGDVFLLTKHRADTMTTLYRLDSRHENQTNELTLIQRANLRGMVTAASSWNDGERIAVLTYYGVWLFEPPEQDGARMFEGVVRWLPIKARQAEAIDFIDREALIITNEQRDVFHVPVDWLLPVELR